MSSDQVSTVPKSAKYSRFIERSKNPDEIVCYFYYVPTSVVQALLENKKDWTDDVKKRVVAVHKIWSSEYEKKNPGALAYDTAEAEKFVKTKKVNPFSRLGRIILSKLAHSTVSLSKETTVVSPITPVIMKSYNADVKANPTAYASIGVDVTGDEEIEGFSSSRSSEEEEERLRNLFEAERERQEKAEREAKEKADQRSKEEERKIKSYQGKIDKVKEMYLLHLLTTSTADKDKVPDFDKNSEMEEYIKTLSISLSGKKISSLADVIAAETTTMSYADFIKDQTDLKEFPPRFGDPFFFRRIVYRRLSGEKIESAKLWAMFMCLFNPSGVYIVSNELRFLSNDSYRVLPDASHEENLKIVISSDTFAVAYASVDPTGKEMLSVINKVYQAFILEEYKSNLAEVDTLKKRCAEELGRKRGSGRSRSNLDDFKRAEKTLETVIKASDKLVEFWKIREPVRVDISAAPYSVKNWVMTPKAVQDCLTTNALDANDNRDVILSIIIVKLASIGMIPCSQEYNEGAVPEGTLAATEMKIQAFEGLAKTMCFVSLFAYCQGYNQDAISWFQSFTAVKGHFITESRFTYIIKMIISAGKMEELMSLITIRDVLTANKVFQFRLTRFSTPGLIETALKKMPYDGIWKYFNNNELADYRRFLAGGVLAQIAAGPLNIYCKGELNPLTDIPTDQDVGLSNLAPITNMPYHQDSIRKAYIILEETQTDFGKWYQGMKSMKDSGSSDRIFRNVVREYNDILRRKTTEAIAGTKEIEEIEAEIESGRRGETPSSLVGWIV
jgi:hypothetical protein